jgi:hypothetical protein
MSVLRTPRVLTYTEGTTRDTRKGEGIEGPPESSGRGRWEEKGRRTRAVPEVPAVGTAREGYPAMEARQGKPGNGTKRKSNPVGTMAPGYTGIEARMGKPGTIANLESTVPSENPVPGRPEPAPSPWGVVSGIVLGDGESPSPGEGPDGSTPPAKETRAGQVGLEPHEPTSRRATALGRMAYAQASTTEEPDAGKLHVRVRAGGAG